MSTMSGKIENMKKKFFRQEQFLVLHLTRTIVLARFLQIKKEYTEGTKSVL